MQRQRERHRMIVTGLADPADFVAEQQADEEDRMADPQDRAKQDRIHRFDE